MMIPEGLLFCHGAKIHIACESALAQTADFAVPLLITTTEQMLVPLPEEYYFTLSRECELWHLMLVPNFLESQEAAPDRPGHRFGSAADTHLGEDRFTVRFHRPFCDKKGCRNLFIALSLCHQL